MADANAGHQADLAFGGLEAGAKVEILHMQEKGAVEPAERPVIFSCQEHRRTADRGQRQNVPRHLAFNLDPGPAEAPQMQRLTQQVRRRRQIAPRSTLYLAALIDHDGAQQCRPAAQMQSLAKRVHRALAQHAIGIEDQHMVGFDVAHGEIAAGGKPDIALAFENAQPRLGCRAPGEFGTILRRIAVIHQDEALDHGIGKNGRDGIEQHRAGAITDHGHAHAARARGEFEMVDRACRTHERTAPATGKGRPAEHRNDRATMRASQRPALGDHARQATDGIPDGAGEDRGFKSSSRSSISDVSPPGSSGTVSV